MALTVPVGEISPELNRLIKVNKKALKRGIRNVRPGNTFGDIGNAIQRYVEDQGLGLVRELCGHGIGKELHEDPQILNYGKRHTGPKIKEGMVICIEPMVTTGDWRIKKGPDGHAFVTKDGSFSAHFEHMMAVTSNGARVLTE
jgi:methionyl aminopeptidase